MPPGATSAYACSACSRLPARRRLQKLAAGVADSDQVKGMIEALDPVQLKEMAGPLLEKVDISELAAKERQHDWLRIVA